MNIMLIQPEEENTILFKLYYAIKNCTSKEYKLIYDREEAIRLISHCYDKGHMGIFEHAVFTFKIAGISRACANQLTRYRMASFTQQSQRYVDMSDVGYVENIPIINKILNKPFKIYKKLIKKGIPKEEARAILPMATKTSVVMTINARELFHMFQQRLCVHAQGEIRDLFQCIYAMMLLKYGGIFADRKILRCDFGLCEECKD
jgi:thymidylate synthase (FAD)